MTAAAAEWVVTVDTIRRGARRLEIEPDRSGRFTTHQIDLAIHGDLKAEKTRLTKADADLKELELKRERSELVAMSDAEQLIRSKFQPIRERLTSAEASLSARCNPADPEHARGEIRRWIDETMRLLQ